MTREASMRRRNPTTEQPTRFEKNPEIMLDGFLITKGDLVKVKGEHGSKFKFQSLTTNLETGAQWIDCFEIQRGQVGAYRSFKSDSIKRIPQRGKRAKRVI
jgi:hypothetical protein